MKPGKPLVQIKAVFTIYRAVGEADQIEGVRPTCHVVDERINLSIGKVDLPNSSLCQTEVENASYLTPPANEDVVIGVVQPSIREVEIAVDLGTS